MAILLCSLTGKDSGDIFSFTPMGLTIPQVASPVQAQVQVRALAQLQVAQIIRAFPGPLLLTTLALTLCQCCVR